MKIKLNASFEKKLMFTVSTVILLDIFNFLQVFTGIHKAITLCASLIIFISAVLALMLIGKKSSSINKSAVMAKPMADELHKQNLLNESTGLTGDMIAIISNLQGSTHETTKSIEQVTSTIYEIAQGSTEQSRNMQETADLIAMITEATGEVTHNFERMEEQTEATSSLIESSHETVEQLKAYTENTIENSSHVADIINEMNSKSEKMSNIVRVISQFASQTNLLALNAAIEAARAGSAGRGFAVVAEEIKKLAEQVSASAKDISAILNETLNETKTAATKVSNTNEIIRIQKNAIFDIVDVFTQIRANLSNLVSEISTSKLTLEEVNISIKEINTQAQSVSTIIESNAAATEEVSAAAEEQLSVVESIHETIISLLETSQKLNEKMKKFSV